VRTVLPVATIRPLAQRLLADGGNRCGRAGEAGGPGAGVRHWQRPRRRPASSRNVIGGLGMDAPDTVSFGSACWRPRAASDPTRMGKSVLVCVSSPFTGFADERAHRLQVPARSSGNVPRRRSHSRAQAWPHPTFRLQAFDPLCGLERDVEAGGRDDPEVAECFSSQGHLCHMLQVVAVSYCGLPVVR
jgi:hypothetical protein